MLGSAPSIPRRAWWALAGIVLLGAALRFYGLGKDSFWLDELIRVHEARHASPGGMAAMLRGDVHPPGYILILHALSRMGFESEAAYRLPSALAGVALLPILFLLGARFWSHREGLAAALFGAVLHCPVSFSQEAAPYALLMAVTAGATCLWLPMLNTLRREARLRWNLAIPYVLLATSAYYLHYFGILFFGLQALASAALCLRNPRALAILIGLYAATGIGFLPWLPTFLEQLGNKQEVAAFIAPPKLHYFSQKFVRRLFNEWHPFMWLALAAYLYLLVISHLRRGEEREAKAWWDRPGLLLALWFVLPFLIVYAVSKLGKPMYQDRYLMISLAPAYLLFARAAVRLGEHLGAKRAWPQTVLCGALALCFVWHLTFKKAYYSSPQKQQFREAIAYAVEKADPQTALVCWFGEAGPHYTEYYFERLGTPHRFELAAGRAADIARMERFLAERDPPRVVYVNLHIDPEDAFVQWLNRRLRRLEAHETFVNARVWVFEANDP